MSNFIGISHGCIPIEERCDIMGPAEPTAAPLDGDACARGQGEDGRRLTLAMRYCIAIFPFCNTCARRRGGPAGPMMTPDQVVA